MKLAKKIFLEKKWNELVRSIEPDRFILLKGKDDHFILGWDFENEFKLTSNETDFDALHDFCTRENKSYIFGCISYDVKNQIEPFLKSENRDVIEFPELYFFTTKHVLEFRNREFIYFGDSEISEISDFFNTVNFANQDQAPIHLDALTSKEEYIKNVKQIQTEIQNGNIYEMNYCIGFQKSGCELNGLETFEKLNQLADAPFSVYLNSDSHTVVCASPERYVQKSGNKISSQPIKGTARRGNNHEEDIQIKLSLKSDPKERAENSMIVDLVRNDLSKIATKNSVCVDELCEVYSFKTVHQLISTISCDLKEALSLIDVLKATFPMGSMTGAPKIAALQLAERIENFKRGLYSGSIGYMRPNGDFDFNVIIRSVLYNKISKVVSCGVGGAITIQSNPEKEYDECLLKLAAMQKALC